MLENNNDLEKRLHDANEKIKSLETELAEAKENNEIYSSTEILKSAKKIKDELIEKAQNEADNLIKNAERQSEKYRTETIKEAEEYKDKVINDANAEVDNIRTKRDEYQESYDQLFNQLISMRDIIDTVLNREDHLSKSDTSDPLTVEIAKNTDTNNNAMDQELSNADFEVLDNQEDKGEHLDIIMEDIPLNL